MTAMSSSPVLYPPSSSPPRMVQKRRLFQTFPTESDYKRNKITSESEPKKGEDIIIRNQFDKDAQHEPEKAGEVLNIIDHGLDARERRSQSDRTPASPDLPPQPRSLLRRLPPRTTVVKTSSGESIDVCLRAKSIPIPYDKLAAERSVTNAGRAKKAYYGVDIHKLIDEADIQRQLNEAQSEVQKQATIKVEGEKLPLEHPPTSKLNTTHQLWTEKYRAKKFTELVGDERTHRSVLRWLKSWDSIVFRGETQIKPKRIFEDKTFDSDQQHRKILLLTGPPGLGKTTLAHVCAKQAGYEVLEINASDDRSRDVVKGRIKDALGTGNVRTSQVSENGKKTHRPICVVVDEVDGAVTGSAANGGEGGFIKALIDLVQLDQRNSSRIKTQNSTEAKNKKGGDKFRLFRPLILICNDIYAPSLRLLRTSSIAEIVQVRRPPIDKVCTRLKAVFEKENIICDGDAIRRLCENSWGLGSTKQGNKGGKGVGEGDIRSILVQGEWIAHKFRNLRSELSDTRLSRRWVDSQFTELSHTNGGRGLSRGGSYELVERIFREGAGLSNISNAISSDNNSSGHETRTDAVGVAEIRKRAAINALREMIDACGEHDRVMTDCFATYPTQVFQDDVLLSKPISSYDWLHFHDSLSSRVYSDQNWELTPYLSTSACGFHHLFASINKGNAGWREEKQEVEQAEIHPFGGPRADFAAHEAEKQKRSVLTELQSSFSANMLRLYTSIDNMALELMPNVGRMLAPDVKPVVIGGSGGSPSVASVRKESEKNCVGNSVRIMDALKITFEKIRIDVEGSNSYASGGFAYRMEPPLDTFTSFYTEKATGSITAPVRFAVRQVLDQDLKKEKLLQNSISRQARSSLLASHVDHSIDEDKENGGVKKSADTIQKKTTTGKRDFFGRIINDVRPVSSGNGATKSEGLDDALKERSGRVWVSFHEGFSNAVRKPISLKEFVESF